MKPSRFGKKYFYGTVYQNYDNYLDYDLMADYLLSCFKFNSFLDIGCGCGNLAKTIKKKLKKKRHQRAKIYGIDSSNFAVQRAKVPYIIRHDCAKPLPFADNSFDLVYIYTTFSYLKTLAAVRQAMLNAYRVTKKYLYFEDVFSKKEALDPESFDPYRLRVLTKKAWVKLWRQIINPQDKLIIKKGELVIKKSN